MAEVTVAQSVAELEGTLARIEIEGVEGGHAVAVATVEGTAYAFQDLCTHQQCSLSDGFLDEYAIICPCHSSVFDVRTGEVLLGPATIAIQTYRCRTDAGVVTVEVDTP
jgi:3-phenylpropionate/trans-cinnamate dioxygenase ferredoxin subunit